MAALFPDSIAGSLADMPSVYPFSHPFLFRYLPFALAIQTHSACERPVYTNIHQGMLCIIITYKQERELNFPHLTGMTQTASFDEVDRVLNQLDMESASSPSLVMEVL